MAADVRSMLRAQRANRRITHPHASYTSDGKLLCNLCEVMIKTEAGWGSHLHSTGHTLRLSRVKDAAAAATTTRGVDGVSSGGNSSKKRKAEGMEELREEKDKRKRMTVAEKEEEDGRNAVEKGGLEERPQMLESKGDETQEPQHIGSKNGIPRLPEQSAQDPGEVDANELAAFERELADLEQQHSSSPSTFPRQQNAIDARYAPATISAAPLTAEEIAAQAREEQSAQRGRKDVEIEAEKEDAARLLEEELEEMEGLEERVRRLRQRREEIRRGSVSVVREEGARPVLGGEVSEVDGNGSIGDAGQGDDDEEDEEDEDDWFGG